tara:strand:- start:2258 stop:3238 length:981 start_codon:yes stop_codon:yes gene_type:complete
MDKLINEIYSIIKDYRREDLGLFYRKEITSKHIKTWIDQFDEEDREFLLSELLYILPESYLSKESTLNVIGEEFETYKNDFKYDSVQEFLKETKFLRCQPAHKSQNVLLDFTNEILQKLYGMSIDDCGTSDIKNWIYIDDVLASGKTFQDDILQEIEAYGDIKFKDSNIRIISTFFILHSLGLKNKKYSIEKKLGYDLGNRLKFYRVSEIDNNPYIHSYWNPLPKFNHVYPKECENGLAFLDFIESAFERDYKMSNKRFAFRISDYPKKEEFYSSPENRDRYERILLTKGIEIIQSIGKLKAPSLRPLGMTPPSWKTLGTGSHFFT